MIKGKYPGKNEVIEVNGIKKTLAEWAEIKNIPERRIRERIYLGWSFEDAVLSQKRNRGVYENSNSESTNKKNGKPKGYYYEFVHYTSHSGAYVKKEIW